MRGELGPFLANRPDFIRRHLACLKPRPAFRLERSLFGVGHLPEINPRDFTAHGWPLLSCPGDDKSGAAWLRHLEAEGLQYSRMNFAGAVGRFGADELAG